MIQSANKSHLNEILEIEKIVFTKPWIQEHLQNDLVLGANSENWIYIKMNRLPDIYWGARLWINIT